MAEIRVGQIVQITSSTFTGYCTGKVVAIVTDDIDTVYSVKVINGSKPYEKGDIVDLYKYEFKPINLA